MTDPYINAQLIIYGDFGISILQNLRKKRYSDIRICCKFILNLGRIGTLDALLNFEVYN